MKVVVTQRLKFCIEEVTRLCKKVGFTYGILKGALASSRKKK